MTLLQEVVHAHKLLLLNVVIYQPVQPLRCTYLGNSFSEVPFKIIVTQYASSLSSDFLLRDYVSNTFDRHLTFIYKFWLLIFAVLSERTQSIESKIVISSGISESRENTCTNSMDMLLDIEFSFMNLYSLYENNSDLQLVQDVS